MSPFGIGIQNDGRIVAVGGARLGEHNPTWAVARYETDGSLDATFGEGGKLTTDLTPGYDSVYQVVVQPDGKIVAGGTAGFTRFAVARYLAS